MAEVVRPLNNSAVLVDEGSGHLAIYLGKGIGFKAQKGSLIDAASADHVFVAANTADTTLMAEQLTDLPLEMIQLARHLTTRSGLISDEAHGSTFDARTQSTILALADHISFAIERHRTGISMSYPLKWEVAQLYPREWELGHWAVEQIHELTGIRLADDEAIPLALHFVNLQFARGNFARTAEMTEWTYQVVHIVETALGTPLNVTSMDVARFVTHLHYLFVRLRSGKQITSAEDSIAPTIRQVAGKNYLLAEHVRSALAMKGTTLTDGETAYLALHIARLRDRTV